MMKSNNKRTNRKTLIVFVVLHYLTTNQTIDCVDSIIEKEKKRNYRIIIVDNCSNNGSFEILKTKFANNKKIIFLANSSNLGFARGNNVGFKYAKNCLKPDYIVLCNNDIILLDDIFDKVKKRFLEKRFAVLGPKERLPNGTVYYMNPKLMNTEQVRGNIKLYEFRKKHPLRALLSDLKRSKNDEPPEGYLDDEHQDVVLHGAFLVFAKPYIDAYDGLDDRTFMYGEESLLAVRLKKSSLLSVYAPEIEVLHNCSSATKAISINRLKRIRTRATYELESAKILLEELKHLDKK